MQSNFATLGVRTLVPVALATAALFAPTTSNAINVYSNDFEGALGPKLTISTIGSFNSSPGVVASAAFGSTQAFSFGRSTCAASCFGNFVTTLTLDLGTQTYISRISFKEIELFGNWGSNGSILLDGLPVASSTHFGSIPDNDRTPDVNFRLKDFAIEALATRIQFRVVDITRESAIQLDDLVVTSVPEPSSWLLYLIGMASIIFVIKRQGADA